MCLRGDIPSPSPSSRSHAQKRAKLDQTSVETRETGPQKEPLDIGCAESGKWSRKQLHHVYRIIITLLAKSILNVFTAQTMVFNRKLH